MTAGLLSVELPGGPVVTVKVKPNGRRRRSMSLFYLQGGGFLVETPLRCTHADVRDAVCGVWREGILRHLRSETAAAGEATVIPSHVQILGENVALRCGEMYAPKGEALLLDGVLITSAERPEDVKKAVRAFYRNRLEEEVLSRLLKFHPHVWRPWTKISYGSARSAWGRCNSRGEIRFSLSLLCCRPKEIDYVVAHELAHLRHLNHKPEFWREVTRLMPDWREAYLTLRSSPSFSPWFLT